MKIHFININYYKLLLIFISNSEYIGYKTINLSSISFLLTNFNGPVGIKLFG